MRDVLVSSDYIVNVLPSTPATRYLLNKDSLAVCATKKPVFINVGRGDVISEDEIISALDNEIFSKAVLDVFETEPLPQESKLWDHPLVTVTPHISGSVFPEDVAAVMIQNLDRKLAGQPLEYQVDWANGY
jgi:phosphoglycerate dehydrogenase-like enzyme